MRTKIRINIIEKLPQRTNSANLSQHIKTSRLLKLIVIRERIERNWISKREIRKRKKGNLAADPHNFVQSRFT